MKDMYQYQLLVKMFNYLQVPAVGNVAIQFAVNFYKREAIKPLLENVG